MCILGYLQIYNQFFIPPNNISKDQDISLDIHKLIIHSAD